MTVGRVINELFRKGVDVVYDKADMLHVSGHACQEELKIIHALTKPKFFIPLHGEQRMLQIHKRVAEGMGMAPRNIVVAENGSVIELTTKHINGLFLYRFTRDVRYRSASSSACCFSLAILHLHGLPLLFLFRLFAKSHRAEK